MSKKNLMESTVLSEDLFGVPVQVKKAQWLKICQLSGHCLKLGKQRDTCKSVVPSTGNPL